MAFKPVLLNFILVFLLVTSCQPNHPSIEQKTSPPKKIVQADTSYSDSSATKRAHMNFISDRHDFGTIIQGEKVFFSFEFSNDGAEDLVISMARGSCGCTVPTYPKHPFQPGEKGNIDVVFDSENLMGISEKTITVLSNSYPNGIEVLTIRVNVIPQN